MIEAVCFSNEHKWIQSEHFPEIRVCQWCRMVHPDDKQKAEQIRLRQKFGAVAWAEYIWPDWVPATVRDQIQSFWSGFGRNLKDWAACEDDERFYRWRSMPEMGETVMVIRKGERLTGRFIFAWNNIARLILPDGTYRVISSCDTFTHPEAAKWEQLAAPTYD